MSAPIGFEGGFSREAASVTEAAVGKAVRAATEAHLVCYGAFAVATALAELRSRPPADEAPLSVVEATMDAAVEDSTGGEPDGGFEADYEPAT